ncbi:MAG: class II fumarate hydratase [Nitrospiraceae bacterium]|nr:class II fumarate hydratase [Nitrospiraceae bacterium]
MTRGEKFREEEDTLGKVKVPAEAYWGAQTERALDNFPSSGARFHPVFFRAIAYIKLACAAVNSELGLLDKKRARAIMRASKEILSGRMYDQFPVDIFQTGSGTSTNMNVNEVIATRANEMLTGIKNTRHPVHPNDHVNMGQSSNDVIPSAIHLSALLLVTGKLLPAMAGLKNTLDKKAARYKTVVKTGRTHMMDAMPVTLGQELSGWAAQTGHLIEELNSSLPALRRLAMGGTAVGTGINTPPGFGGRVAKVLSRLISLELKKGLELKEAQNHFMAQASQDAALALSGRLKTAASAFIKMANDLKLMNSGPACGLNEIRLKAVQPGSSIMPGKVNPVMPEAVRMIGAQVIGNGLTVALGDAMGEFELNTMLPVIAHNLLQSITLLGNASLLLQKAIEGFEVNAEHMQECLDKNQMTGAVLSPAIGYDKAAEVIKKAREGKKTVRELVVQLGYMDEKEARRLQDPESMTHQKKPRLKKRRG